MLQLSEQLIAESLIKLKFIQRRRSQGNKRFLKTVIPIENRLERNIRAFKRNFDCLQINNMYICNSSKKNLHATLSHCHYCLEQQQKRTNLFQFCFFLLSLRTCMLIRQCSCGSVQFGLDRYRLVGTTGSVQYGCFNINRLARYSSLGLVQVSWYDWFSLVRLVRNRSVNFCLVWLVRYRSVSLVSFCWFGIVQLVWQRSVGRVSSVQFGWFGIVRQVESNKQNENKDTTQFCFYLLLLRTCMLVRYSQVLIDTNLLVWYSSVWIGTGWLVRLVWLVKLSTVGQI